MRSLVATVVVAVSLPCTLSAQRTSSAPLESAAAAPFGSVHSAPAGARPLGSDTARRSDRAAPPAVQPAPGTWVGGAGGCRRVVPRWTALGTVLGVATPLALRAVGGGSASGKDVATSAVIGTGAGALTGTLLCRQAGRA